MEDDGSGLPDGAFAKLDAEETRRLRTAAAVYTSTTTGRGADRILSPGVAAGGVLLDLMSRLVSHLPAESNTPRWSARHGKRRVAANSRLSAGFVQT